MGCDCLFVQQTQVCTLTSSCSIEEQHWKSCSKVTLYNVVTCNTADMLHLCALHGDCEREASPEGHKVGVHPIGPLLHPILTPKASCYPLGHPALNGSSGLLCPGCRKLFVA